MSVSNSVILGKSGSRNIHIDLPTLLRTRLLIQANSGGGKSWALRRIAEQLYGKIPVHIIDPEGEFATLREKYGYVLIGENGEAAADIRSAGLVAQRLLELRCSAVIDLYEAFRSKPADRRTWVRRYMESLVDAPKSLWQPLVVIVDEAHKYCPQETPKAGTREERENIIGCKEAMIALSTVGRKRRFCAVWATQRLAKVDKDASAELLNRLIGPTFEDVDIDRAADMLSVSRDERSKFKKSIRVLEPGNFYAIGRAVATERILVAIGPVTTTHPDVDSDITTVTPPLPARIKHLLPKLADLPKEAEDKAKSVADLKTQVKELQRELKSKQGHTPAAKVSAPAPPKVIRERIEVYKTPKWVVEIFRNQRKAQESMEAAIRRLGETLREGEARLKDISESVSKPIVTNMAVSVPKVNHASSATQMLKRISVERASTNGNSDSSDITGPMQRILDAVAWMESIGVTTPKQTAVAFLAGYTFGGGGFNNPKGRLVTRGLLRYQGDALELTDEGRALANTPEDALTSEEIHNKVLARLTGPQRKILQVLLESYPEPVQDTELAEKSGYTHGSGGFNNPKGSLRTLNLIEYPEKGMIKAADLLFV